jgi:hypothetical protein
MTLNCLKETEFPDVPVVAVDAWSLTDLWTEVLGEMEGADQQAAPQETEVGATALRSGTCISVVTLDCITPSNWRVSDCTSIQ